MSCNILKRSSLCSLTRTELSMILDQCNSFQNSHFLSQLYINDSVSSSRSCITFCKEACCLTVSSISCVFACHSLSHSSLIMSSCCSSSDASLLSRCPFLRLSCFSRFSCSVCNNSMLCVSASLNRISRNL